MSEKETEKAKKLRILKAYCDTQIKKVSDGSEAICFPDLIQTWSFADTSNHESLLVVVPSILAIFLKTISTQLDFRDFGIALCKYLLQKDQLKLFNRSLTSTKAKEHLISPCIRLLTEIVSFDGGAVARLVYSKREITFKRLDVFLTPNKAQTEEALDESRKSTLRRNTQRYVLANFRFQHAAAKREFVEQHKVIRAFLEHIRRDSRDIVLDIIKAIDRDIAQDSSLPRSTKTKFFNRWNLERLVTLYGYDRDSDAPESETLSIAKEIHKLLTKVCTVSEMGVLLPQTGWYPPGSDPDALLTEDDGSIELGLDSPVYLDKYRDSVPVRNGTLSSLIQVLRPESDTLQTELLLTIFKAAPELVADFFTKRTMFTSDPKATPSWLGESAFLFSTVQLPVPANCGWKEKVPAMPPPISVVIENILPRPLTQKTLSRCLNQNTDNVITLFAVRILTVAFRKLQAVLKIFNSDHGIGQSFWNQASAKLIAEFCRRCPPMKDAVLTFKRTPKEDLQQRDAVMELLCMFYETVPSIAFEENFDVTLILVDVLHQLEKPELSADDSELLLSLLQNILKIAHVSASMRWWQQPDLSGMFGDLPTEDKNHAALHKWEHDEIDVAIEKGRIRDLMLCLCSEHEEVRRQAFVGVSRFMAKLKESNYSEWRSIYILSGEFLETANHVGFQTPLPWIAGECAASCLMVLTDPLHKMYGKVNKFLQKRPSWEIGKIPSYWIDKILLNEPEYDDGYVDEITWLLDLFVGGLRTAQDLDIYRRANVFERILSLYNSPTLNASLKKKILHLVFRATQVGGGSTLITRAAAISWVRGQMAGSDPHSAIMSELTRAIYDSSDHERVDKWSGASIPRLVEQIGS
ncbi:Ribosome biogenesis protein Urb1 [Rasamsonia emersonii CBS 393.64]|uniref:Ribosome biogenesis protein Urb1 n=1 Tax=Rasamsonia emersonii (strain ATCC 16479 / CBS 393.64 / IMI 116815) TaxID=1408163 RepID=A0A0F4YDC8_RASE3|nr:Ribosome biogenesis protein Urb1 [Rasamsonia emersonii CBS 393.64]KKA16189.1 Ribosome biogenesis protein Urb1 [Rasamsonia emersonii CBS 393.64]